MRHCSRFLSQRPLSKKELAETPGSIIEVYPQLVGMPAALTVYEPKLKVDMTAYTEQHKFLYDSVFDEDVGNLEVYRSTAAPLINRVFEHGQSSTCFAYGATGSGKTYTMTGSMDKPGVIPLTLDALFAACAEAEDEYSTLLRMQYVEIYNEQIKDLLEPSSANLDVREDPKRGTFVAGATRSGLG